MRKIVAGCLSLLLAASPAAATVFLNEIYINPPGSADNTREFIELCGTPGMKLDGYAVAFLNGAQNKFYPLGSIPPRPAAQEIDEFFSLDGLQLGANGLLVIGVGVSGNYPTLLADTSFQRWNTLWNGGQDTPGKLNNDGSATILLIRNRPGRTQADPTHPDGLRWGKDVCQDDELITPVIDEQTGLPMDQYGDGNLDEGQPNGIDGSSTLDFKGASTPVDLSDDLEVVDEVSYEHDRGWEYDLDGRHVDDGSVVAGLPYRHVHALDDPQGFNPDALARVDYRTAGAGWAPAPGGLGELSGGNNWQDTATEQWIRGEAIIGPGGQGSAPWFYFSNAINTNPDAIQPYMTNVPLWLDDGSGTDYDFGAITTYQVMAGRVNPLSVPYIPGDTDRDGDCDAADIGKLAAVFGEPDWIFSNSYNEAPEGDGGDPATQTRPWDVDATGDNGIEASDLQWTLNFQASTDGRIIGRLYDVDTPSPTGVYLNSNAGVNCTVSTAVHVPSGHPLTALAPNEIIEITVRAAVTDGANTTAGQQNGIMQFVHDLSLSASDVARVESITPLAPFDLTRAEIVTLEGNDGDRGASRINGYTTSFTAGLTVPADLYRVTLRTIGLGTVSLVLVPAGDGVFALSTPYGLKIGHTNQAGNPAAAAYPATLALTVTTVIGDLNGDGSVDADDLQIFSGCLNGPDVDLPTNCVTSDLDQDLDADLKDYSLLQVTAR